MSVPSVSIITPARNAKHMIAAGENLESGIRLHQAAADLGRGAAATNPPELNRIVDRGRSHSYDASRLAIEAAPWQRMNRTTAVSTRASLLTRRWRRVEVRASGAAIARSESAQ